jgi:hypothetical protein
VTRARRVVAGLLLLALLLGSVGPAGAGALQFDGSNDRVRWTTLASTLANVSDGAWTLAVLLKRGGTGGWDAISYLLSGTGNGTAEAGVSFKGAATVNSLVIDVDAGQQTTNTYTDTTSPYLIVVSKGAGSATPTVSVKLGSGGAWAASHNFSGAVADQIAATILDIGIYQGASDPFVGHIGVVGWWEGAMSEANKQALGLNWRTSDWWNSAHGQPAFLAELNVACTSVVDLASNASSRDCTNAPTLDAAQTLDSWNFNGTGAGGGAATPLLPLAGAGR